MNNEIIVGILGAIVGAVATLVVGFKDEIKALIGGRTHSDPYEGTWQCKWCYVESGLSHQLDDVVTLKARGSRLTGEGSNSSYGRYTLSGQASPHSAFLTYKGVDRNAELVGSVILKKEAPAVASGVWCQYLAQGTFRSGTVTWTKS